MKNILFALLTLSGIWCRANTIEDYAGIFQVADQQMLQEKMTLVHNILGYDITVLTPLLLV